jgi:hypothetical protein
MERDYCHFRLIQRRMVSTNCSRFRLIDRGII